MKYVSLNGKELDLNADYKVATNDYMLGGGDGYSALTKGTVLINAGNGDLMANDVIEYIIAKGGVSAKVEGRIKTVNQ